jgi:N-acyl-D-amino-acid deacylase
MKEKYGWMIDWRTMSEFFERVENNGISMNYAPLVGHGTIRYMVMGSGYKRYANQNEIDEMIEHIHKAMNEGCIGLSTGLDYDPGYFASQDELIQCVSPLKEYGGVYCTHWRKTGRRQDVKPTTPKYPRIQGIIESIDVCRKTEVPLQIAHIKDGYEVYPTPSPRLQKCIAEATLDVVDEGIKEGLPITFDWQLIYESKLKLLPYLGSLFTPWIRETGSFERLSEFLKMDDYRQDIKEALFSGKWFIKQVSPVSNPHWADQITVWKHANSIYENKTLTDIASMKNRDKLDTLFDLIIEDPFSMGGRFYSYMVWEEVFLKHPRASVCLDGTLEDPEYKKKEPPFSFPKSGSFDRFVTMINRYVGEGKLMTLEETIKKMTYNAAKPHNIIERGILKPNYYADIVLLDLPNLKAMSRNTDPRIHPQGIEYVFVNGKKVVENGKHTGERPGKILKRARIVLSKQ